MRKRHETASFRFARKAARCSDPQTRRGSATGKRAGKKLTFGDARTVGGRVGRSLLIARYPISISCVSCASGRRCQSRISSILESCWKTSLSSRRARGEKKRRQVVVNLSCRGRSAPKILEELYLLRASRHKMWRLGVASSAQGRCRRRSPGD
jgi:hypothetical protein